MSRRLVASYFIDPCNNNMLRSTGSNGFKEHALNYHESTLGINNIKTPAHFHINNNENRTWSTDDVTHINYPKWSAHTANLQQQQPPPFIIPGNQMVMPYSESAITCAPSMLKSNVREFEFPTISNNRHKKIKVATNMPYMNSSAGGTTTFHTIHDASHSACTSTHQDPRGIYCPQKRKMSETSNNISNVDKKCKGVQVNINSTTTVKDDTILHLNNFGPTFLQQKEGLLHNKGKNVVLQPPSIRDATYYFSSPTYVQQCQPLTTTSIRENYIETARPSTDNSTSAQQNFITSRQNVSQLYIDIGDCDYMCQHCNAIFWYGERSGTTSRSQPTKYSKCCAGGQVRLQKEMEPPMYFKQLLKDKHFMDNIRAYNQMFSMTSFCAQIDDSVNDGRGPYVFKISGEIHHWIGTICQTNINEPKFMQLYIYDTQNEVAHRMEPFGGKDGSGLKPEIVQNLIQILDEHNELDRVFRTARERCNQPNVTEFKIQLYNVVGGRQYQLPTSGTLGAIVIEPDTNTQTDYDVIIEYKDRRPQRINKLHNSYMSLQFPLLFVYGQPGYNTKMTLQEGTKNRK
ncbi:helitron helicase-like domain-containing protein [Artemisia annua]|uniref:Helitron helicase-like domain-containing protein n=1 Tax=Artemisia annua TaxID=35608 RepID=A0A2U1P4B7_ARTAN|nr:helitron helicase-like domain-containing protein [Artemisia annua]